MTFFESIKTVFRKYAEFEGRATRPEFWWFALFSVIVGSALSALTTFSVNPNMFELTATASTVTGFASFAGIWAAAVLIPSLAVTVRRLRDAGKDWTNILWIVVPVAGFVVLLVKLAAPTMMQTVPSAPTP